MCIQLWNQGIYRQWTELEDCIVTDMAGKYSPSEIAKAVNRSQRAVYCRAQFLDVSLKFHAKNKPVVTACYQLRQQGKSFTAIARALGIPSGSVPAYLIKYSKRGSK
ncbi:hypothetical protein [Serratia proteamaculans]|uniref:Uncharacterized protein n=1 Tax=Serratia proteamaculans TaxID=28151 RepID=A0A5Q2V949_SERPR|nr:hypothetical protein [Serratia proteamaculans]QGH60766.1 hypothetical protein GHV41_07875 [Serratia proteamaculans]